MKTFRQNQYIFFTNRRHRWFFHIFNDIIIVRLTEHQIADGEYYLFAINYSNNDRCTDIVFDRDVDVTTVFGAELTGGKAMIPACDGALYKITEKR